MKSVYFATSNRGKFAEALEILGSRISRKDVEIDEIQDIDVRKVVSAKAREIYKKVRKPVIVEDTGLYINQLNDFPGALIKPLLERLGKEGICRLLDGNNDRRAHIETAIAYTDGKTTRIFNSVTNGIIVSKPRGKNGFGFDFIFQPDGSEKVLAEMDIHEKNSFSARGKSFRKFKRYRENVIS